MPQRHRSATCRKGTNCSMLQHFNTLTVNCPQCSARRYPQAKQAHAPYSHTNKTACTRNKSWQQQFNWMSAVTPAHSMPIQHSHTCVLQNTTLQAAGQPRAATHAAARPHATLTWHQQSGLQESVVPSNCWSVMLGKAQNDSKVVSKRQQANCNANKTLVGQCSHSTRPVEHATADAF